MLSKRLSECLNLILGTTLADIGADHGYASIEAVKRGIVAKAYACDINPGPLAQAQENILNSGLSSKVIPCLKDGMMDLFSDVDCILIAGMGGYLMKDILTKGNHDRDYCLVLSPNNEAFLVREWLMNNGYCIMNEKIVFDRNHFYEIIQAKKGKMRLSPLELAFGPININKQDEAFLKKQKMILASLEKIDLAKVKNQEEIINKMELIKASIK